MKNSFGNSVQFTLFGESHSKQIGIVIDGLAPGIVIDLSDLNDQLAKRKSVGKISTARHEADTAHIVSGYFHGHTTGTPLTILFENGDVQSDSYEDMKDTPRPSHADYAAQEKYLGFQDYRGGGHFSGRLTAPIVAAGAICRQVLKAHGIWIGSHILSLAGIFDTAFSETEKDLEREIFALDTAKFPTLSEARGEEMIAAIERVAQKGDSVGGVLDTAILHCPAGIGEPFFGSVESRLSQLLYSIPAVKGVAFGLGFDFANGTGSEENDAFCIKDGHILTRTNFNGGINGGVTNGMPIRFHCVVKPTPSIFLPQQTVNLKTGTETTFAIKGRHDPAVIHRARVVVDSVTAMALLDLICERYGYLWMTNERN